MRDFVKQTARAIRNRLGLRADSTRSESDHCGFEWYDHAFATTKGYCAHYTQSSYYFLWTVIGDRIHRAGIGRILEIGCGPGQFAQLLFDQGIESYTGLDFSPKAIEMARASVPRGRFVVDDARTSDLYSQVEHEAIICTEVLEHIPDDLVVVSRFGPGKRCLCTVPNFPYESHVRHFEDGAAVASRYQRFFRDFDVVTLRSPAAADVRYFLFEGVRNEIVHT